MTRLVALGAAAIGLAVSAYLTWLHYSGSLALCVGVGGCEAVQTSRYSTIGDVPIALIGTIGMAILLTIAAVRIWGADVFLDLGFFALSLVATLYMSYLTYVEVFVLGAICPWCVSVAVCAVVLFACAALDLRAGSPDG